MNKLEILFENSEIRIINKPSGLAVQGGQGITNSVDTILPSQVGEKIYLVHRLDKETAGLLITAKTPKDATKWTGLIGSKVVTKKYVALCFGSLKQKKGIFSDTLNEKGQQKQAITHYSVIETYKLQPSANFMDISECSLIELTLETGRMHQIRKHLAIHQCPIIADDKYGDFKKNKIAQKNGKMKKLFLCAKELSFPSDNGKMEKISIDYPDYFFQAMNFFSSNSLTNRY